MTEAGVASLENLAKKHMRSGAPGVELSKRRRRSIAALPADTRARMLFFASAQRAVEICRREDELIPIWCQEHYKKSSDLTLVKMGFLSRPFLHSCLA